MNGGLRIASAGLLASACIDLGSLRANDAAVNDAQGGDGGAPSVTLHLSDLPGFCAGMRIEDDLPTNEVIARVLGLDACKGSVLWSVDRVSEINGLCMLPEGAPGKSYLSRTGAVTVFGDANGCGVDERAWNRGVCLMHAMCGAKASERTARDTTWRYVPALGRAYAERGGFPVVGQPLALAMLLPGDAGGTLYAQDFRNTDGVATRFVADGLDGDVTFSSMGGKPSGERCMRDGECAQLLCVGRTCAR